MACLLAEFCLAVTVKGYFNHTTSGLGACLLTRGGRQFDPHPPFVPGDVRLEAALAKHLKHRPVLRPNGRRNGEDMLLLGMGGQAFQQDGAESSAVAGVIDEEGDLSRISTRQTDIIANSQDVLLGVLASGHHIGHAGDTVDVEHAVDLAAADLG